MNFGWLVVGHGVVRVTEGVGSIRVLLLLTNFEAEPGVVSVRRAVVESSRNARFMPRS